MRDTTSRSRLRELAKYHSAFSSLPQFKPSRRPDPDIHRPTDLPPETHDDQYLAPRLSTDTVLTGLAQLATLRLKYQRCFISLSDDQFHHVLAEATQSISPYNQTDHEPGDSIILGAQSIPRASSICPQAFEIFTQRTEPAFESPSFQADAHHVWIPNLATEPKTQHHPALRHPTTRLCAYLEVPLRGLSGCVIGSIALVHDTPRHMGPRDVAHLQELSYQVLAHLDRVRDREDHMRAERVLQGLGHFIRGKNSLSDWSHDTPGQTTIEDIRREVPHLPSFSALRENPSASPPEPSTPSAGPTDPASQSTLRDDAASCAAPGSASTTELASAEAEQIVPRSADFEAAVKVENPAHEHPDSPDPLRSHDVRGAFSRAANLLRQGMDLDATCFLEVPQNERFKTHRGPTGSDKDKASSTSADDDSTAESSEVTPEDMRNGSPGQRAQDSMCHRLGYATRLKASIAGSTSSASFMTIPAPLLTRLAARYPQGHIFKFDSGGAWSSGDEKSPSDLEGTAPASHSRKDSLSAKLWRFFPHASSTIFMPLYDNERQQIYAGFLGWTTNPLRGLLKHEIIYVAGFTNSVMCEVMRLEALAMDNAKSNFISSISHELRSPLHGVLAASQLLRESEPLPRQSEYLQMIDTCARTLLDILNHLLDHAKINQYTKQQGNKTTKKTNRRRPVRTHSAVTDINLASVVEESVASIAASGYELRSAKGLYASGLTPLNGSSMDAADITALSVPVLVNISPRARWTFSTEAGSWRRIVMNLVGNALKYTNTGCVMLDLSYRESSRHPAHDQQLVELKITDTGQGISAEYLKHRLYTPFAQENNLSVGTGLGLSLVHQIVSSLNGRIEVRSELGTGTEVIVKVPLAPPSQGGGTTEISDDKMATWPKSLGGYRVHFEGFGDWPSIDEEATGIPSPRSAALIAIKESISTTMQMWFDIETVTADADLTVVEERTFNAEVGRYDIKGHKIIVVGLEGRDTGFERLVRADVVYLLPPIGPMRLAQGLRRLLEVYRGPNEQSLARSKSSASVVPQKDASQQDLAVEDVTIPQEVAAPPSAESYFPDMGQKDETLAPSQNKTAILLVDDNEINLKILVACISRVKDFMNNNAILTACNGKEAVAKFEASIAANVRITTIFMDISMPVMDGFAATRAIRSHERRMSLHHRGARSRVVALTGLASAEALSEIDSCGFDDYLRKPVDIRAIRRILTNDIDTK